MLYELIIVVCLIVIYIAIKSYKKVDDDIIEPKPDFTFTYILNKVSKS